MSPIGRIFVVLNLILSAAFFGWAYNALSTTDNYKQQLDEAKTAHTAELAKKDEEISKLTVDLNGATEQQRQFLSERDQKTAEADGLRRELDELKSRHDGLQASLKKIEATLGDYNSTIAQLGQQKDAAVEKAHEAQRERDSAVSEKDAAEVARRDAEEAQKNAETRIADLERERGDLMEKISDLDTRMAKLVEMTGADTTGIIAPPKIEGYVLEVNRDLKLVVINKGAKDQVKPGYTFSIYRGSQYKGQVRINSVQDGLASGIIEAEKSPITKGDSAATTL